MARDKYGSLMNDILEPETEVINIVEEATNTEVSTDTKEEVLIEEVITETIEIVKEEEPVVIKEEIEKEIKKDEVPVNIRKEIEPKRRKKAQIFVPEIEIKKPVVQDLSIDDIKITSTKGDSYDISGKNGSMYGLLLGNATFYSRTSPANLEWLTLESVRVLLNNGYTLVHSLSKLRLNKRNFKSFVEKFEKNQISHMK